MFLLCDIGGQTNQFDTKAELKEYIENRHAEEGGFDWICEIKDDNGYCYGCTWRLCIEKI